MAPDVRVPRLGYNRQKAMESVGRYQIRGELGRGGMGVVYCAYDPQLDREVAIKVVSLPAGVSGVEAETFRKRLLQEARTAGMLSHAGIVAIHDVLEAEGQPCIVMEFVRGESLENVLKREVRLSTEKAFAVVRDIAGALDFAHCHDVVHRDVKPANILIDTHRHVKIADFGIAKRLNSEMTQTATGATVGTFAYMSPEQLRGETIDGRSDQFSLGVMAYQMLTGRMPFAAGTWMMISHKILHEEPAPPGKDVAGGTAAALMRAMAKDRGQRFATCREFAEAMGASVGAVAPAARSNRTVLALIAAVLAILAGFWIWSAGRTGEPAVATVPEPAKAPLSALPPPAAAPPTSAAPAVITESAAIEGDPSRLEIGGIVAEFAEISAGQFMMGSDHPAVPDHERPVHVVRISRPFWIGTIEVTEGLWAAVTGGAPPPQASRDLPRSGVSWTDAQSFLKRLNARGDGFRYRLPTEAEWEYAARAGRNDDLSRDAHLLAYYQQGNSNSPIAVAQLRPNLWGLHDVLGNVWEWVSDWYAEDYYANSPRQDPRGPETGECRVLRGGSYNTQAMMLSATYRICADPNQRGEEFGLRLVRERSR